MMVLPAWTYLLGTSETTWLRYYVEEIRCWSSIDICPYFMSGKQNVFKSATEIELL